MIERETIERVRDQTRLLDLVKETVKLKKVGLGYVGSCPFHPGTTPSFHLNPTLGFYFCSGCGAQGDALSYLQQLDGLTLTEAVEVLAERAGIPFAVPLEERERHERRRALYEACAAAAAYFERMLREHPCCGHAQAELARRGLTSDSPTGPIADALQAFRVGYAPYGWDGLTLHLRDCGISIQAAEAVGVVSPRRTSVGHYDRFRHRLMFAVTDLHGRVIAFSGRALPEPTADELHRVGVAPLGTSGGEAAAKYVNSPESPVYRKRETVFGLHQARRWIRDADECLLVEGNFDVVSLHAHGVKNAVAPLGTAFTTEQARLIRRFAPRVTFMFDPDAAGRRAVGASRAACNEASLAAKVATLPEGNDPDELVRTAGSDAVRARAQLARPLLEYLIDATLDSGCPVDDAQARAAKVREAAQLLAEEPDPTLRTLATQQAERLAERLGVADPRTFRELSATVRRALDQADLAREPTAARRAQAPNQARSRDQSGAVELEIFGCFLDCPDLLDSDAPVEAGEVLGSEAAEAIDALRQARVGEKGLDLEQLLAKLPPSIHPFAAARLAAPLYERLDDARSKLLDNVNKLKRLQLRCSSPEVEELQRAAASGDFDKEIALLREHERRARKRHGL